MAVEANVGVHGIGDVLRDLRRLDPEYRKAFMQGARQIVAPMIADAKSRYPAMPLSGMARNWAQNGAEKFPYKIAQVKSGVKLKVSTRRTRESVLYVSQGNPAGAIFEVVRASPTPMGRNIRARNSKVLWPAYDREARNIHDGIELLVESAERHVQELMR